MTTAAAMLCLSKADTYSAYFRKDANIAARGLYLEAINADPTFAWPCAELAYAILQAYLYNWYDGDPADAITEMNGWANEALNRDADDPMNAWVKADVSLYSKNFPGAFSGYASLGGATLIKPMAAEQFAYRVDYADMQLLTGNAKEATIIVENVLDQCPVPEKWFYWVLAWAYYVDEQFDASLKVLQTHYANPRNAIRKNLVASLVALDRIGEAQVEAAKFLMEEKEQGITYAAAGEPVFPGLSLIENRVPFQSASLANRWKGDLEKAFGGLLQP